MKEEKFVKIRKIFPKELVKEYGECTIGDSKRTNSSYEDASWSSVYVAEACGYIKEKEQTNFRKAIIKYAKRKGKI